MFGLKLPTIIMLLLALGSAGLVIDRMLEPAAEDTATGATQQPIRASRLSLPMQPYEQPSYSLARSNWRQASPTFRQAPASPGRRSTQQTPLQALIRIRNGRLSVEAYKMPLADLLAKISNRSRIVIHLGALDGQPISIAFEDLPLDVGLRRILEHQDVFFFYGAGQLADTPVAVWVYPGGEGRDIVPAPPENWASTVELEQDLSTSSDWGARARAIEAIIERTGNQSVDDVLYALSDPNPNVRYSALSGALNISLALPAGTLENLAQYDPSHFVRSLALKAIGENRRANRLQVRGMAEAALSDPHPNVQLQAQGILMMLNKGRQLSKRQR